MSGSRIWQESLIGRLAGGAGLAWRQSFFCKWVYGSAQYSRQEALRCSLTARALTAAVSLPARPLELAEQPSGEVSPAACS